MTKLDPRFRRHAAKKTRVAVDERFASMFTDPDFVAPVSVDKYGKARADGGAKEELRRFYSMPDASASGSESDADSRRLADAGVESPFSDEDDPDACGSSDLDEALGAHPLVAPDVPQVAAATYRLALVNADWDAVHAVDIYTMLHAFKPAGGEIRSVAVYVSEFGKTRMAAEAAHGPSIVVPEDDSRHDVDEEEDAQLGSDDDCHTPAARALKRYQLERLRYHYAVVECDSAATASALYAQCDGAEFETSTVFVDLRYVPDETEIPPLSEAVDVCTSLPRSYRPQHGAVSAALQLTRPVLAWDAPDARRLDATRRAFCGADDADQLVASGSSSEDEDAGGLREKYRAMLLGGGASAFGRGRASDNDDAASEGDAGSGSDEDGNREMTFEVEAQPKAGRKRLSAAALSRRALKAKRAPAPDAAEAARLALLIRPEDAAEDEDVVLRSRAAPAAGEDAVRAIVADERFRPMLEDAAYALDPTHPLYRRASAAAAIARERALRVDE